MKKQTLQEMAYNSEMHSRFIAVSEDLGRELTDKEIYDNAIYFMQTIPYAGYDENYTNLVTIQMKGIIRKYKKMHNNHQERRMHNDFR